jgi:hypothetical protein
VQRGPARLGFQACVDCCGELCVIEGLRWCRGDLRYNPGAFTVISACFLLLATPRNYLFCYTDDIECGQIARVHYAYCCWSCSKPLLIEILVLLEADLRFRVSSKTLQFQQLVVFLPETCGVWLLPRSASKEGWENKRREKHSYGVGREVGQCGPYR